MGPTRQTFVLISIDDKGDVAVKMVVNRGDSHSENYNGFDCCDICDGEYGDHGNGLVMVVVMGMMLIALIFFILLIVLMLVAVAFVMFELTLSAVTIQARLSNTSVTQYW